MNETRNLKVIGLEPWLPWPLKSWTWWNKPIRAERLAALRIALALCLLFNILTSYRVHLQDFFGDGQLGGGQMFATYGAAPNLNWSLLRGLDDPMAVMVAFWTWAAAAIMLLVGCWTRLSAILTWVLSMSFANANPFIDNAGDTIRTIALFYLVLCPCGAVWSVDGLVRRHRHGAEGPVYVWPWPLRLLFIQLILIYFVNGLYKVTGPDWLEGDSLYYVLGDLTLTRFSIAQLPVPLIVIRMATWLVLIWELTFPVLVLFRRTRCLALLFGVIFHLGIFATMELGGFVPYVLCLYVPLLPSFSVRDIPRER